MKTTTLSNLKKSIASVTIGAMSFSTLAFAAGVPLSTAFADDESTSCSTITLVSGGTTQTAGYTSVNPSASPMDATSYSNGTWGSATDTEMVAGSWLDPSTDSNFTGSGAMWVSTDPTWPGGTNNTEGSATTSQWRLFSDSFTLPADATVTSATLSYASDNAAAVYLNGNATPIASTNVGSDEDVYSATTTSTSNYNQTFTSSFSPVAGSNTLDFVVRNFDAADSTNNPTGLLYKANIHYCTPVVTGSDTAKVTIMKFIDGSMATASSSDSTSFTMNASWNASNVGEGSGTYTLDQYGYGTTTPYTAITTDMALGSSYSTSEATSSTNGASCSDGMRYATTGYTTGATLAEAMSATATSTSPNFSNLQNDEYVIVWNTDCNSNGGTIGGDVTGGQSENGALAVTSITPVRTTATADGSFENGWEYTFNVTVPNDEQDVSMKFANWMSTVGSTTIPVANNIRIMSTQASSTDWVTLTAANTYSTPALHITGDLDPATPGRQIQITVDVAIPSSTVNGSYTTSYGVRSL